MAVSRNTGATASWMTRVMSVICDSMAVGGDELPMRNLPRTFSSINGS
jgi:hypothetical protein